MDLAFEKPFRPVRVAKQGLVALNNEQEEFEELNNGQEGFEELNNEQEEFEELNNGQEEFEELNNGQEEFEELNNGQEEFEDTKGIIRICVSKKNRQHNGQKKKHKSTNNDLQNIYIKISSR